jgi:hypothetical protein
VALSQQTVVRGGVVFAAGVVAASTCLFLATPALIMNYRADARFYESPGFFPRLALAVTVACGLSHLMALVRGRAAFADRDEFDIGEARSNLALTGLLLFLAYIAATPWIGYAAATPLFMLVAGWAAGLGWRVNAGLAAGTTALLYGVFVVGLKVWFPAPEILWVLGWR